MTIREMVVNDQASTRTGDEMGADSLEHDRLADQKQEHGDQRSHDAADQPFEHERAADEPVRRSDELHHLDLPAAGEDREPDRVRDQERRRDQEDDRRDRKRRRENARNGHDTG